VTCLTEQVAWPGHATVLGHMGTWHEQAQPLLPSLIYGNDLQLILYAAQSSRLSDTNTYICTTTGSCTGTWKMKEGAPYSNPTTRKRKICVAWIKASEAIITHIRGFFLVVLKAMPPATVFFTCNQNAGRSQMSAALFELLADPSKAVAESGGVNPGTAIHPEVVAAMQVSVPDFGSLLQVSEHKTCSDALPCL
jgi:hypothetical protein